MKKDDTALFQILSLRQMSESIVLGFFNRTAKLQHNLHTCKYYFRASRERDLFSTNRSEISLIHTNIPVNLNSEQLSLTMTMLLK